MGIWGKLISRFLQKLLCICFNLVFLYNCHSVSLMLFDPHFPPSFSISAAYSWLSFAFFVVFVWTALMKGPWLIAKEARDEISLRHTSWYFYKINGNMASRGGGLLSSMAVLHEISFFFFPFNNIQNRTTLTEHHGKHNPCSVSHLILNLPISIPTPVCFVQCFLRLHCSK